MKARIRKSIGNYLKSKGAFISSVGVLAGSTLFSQILNTGILPLITRLYTPEDFSVLAVFSSILTIASVSACLRFEIAIQLPEKDEDAANVLALAILACSIISAMIALIILPYPNIVAHYANQPALAKYLWLLPISVWLTAIYTASQYWATRKKRFTLIAKTRIVQAAGGGMSQVGMGLAGFGPIGLLIGQSINSGSGVMRLAAAALKYDSSELRKISWPRMSKMLREYRRFPKYSVMEAIANSASVQLPILLVAAIAAAPEAGHLMLASRVMAIPVSLIGASVAQVYLSRASIEYRAGRLDDFTSGVVWGLFKIGVGPIIFLGIISPTSFPLIFGTQWLRAGYLVAWMTPWFIMQYLTSPISMVLHVKGNQRDALILQVFGLILRMGSVLAASLVLESKISEAYSISGFFFYLIYFLFAMRIAGINIKKLFRDRFKAILKLTGAWVLGGVIFIFLAT